MLSGSEVKYDARDFLLNFFLCISLKFSKCSQTSASDNIPLA